MMKSLTQNKCAPIAISLQVAEICSFWHFGSPMKMQGHRTNRRCLLQGKVVHSQENLGKPWSVVGIGWYETCLHLTYEDSDHMYESYHINESFIYKMHYKSSYYLFMLSHVYVYIYIIINTLHHNIYHDIPSLYPQKKGLPHGETRSFVRTLEPRGPNLALHHGVLEPGGTGWVANENIYLYGCF